jgi:outer membrane protein assembly factor BamB
MSRNDTETQEALDLDQRWDELNVGNPAVQRLDRGDQELRELIALDISASPRPEFVAGLMSRLRDEARQIGPIAQPAAVPPFPVLEPVRPVRRMRRMRGLSGAGKVASVLLAASLLFGMMAALVRYPFTSTDGTGGPTVVAPGPQIPDVPMPGADPARSNVQPGPGLTTLPEIKQKADVVGTSIALADNVLVVVAYTTVSAFDVNTLTELWSRKPESGMYSAPTIANGVIYFGYTRDTENGRDDPDNDQLVAMSLADGRELWRVTGAGIYPANPIVIDGVVYSLGGTRQQYNVGAYRATGGEQLWRTDVAARAFCCQDMGIAVANSKLAVSLSDGIMPSLKKDDEPGTISYLAGTTNPHTVGVFDATDGSRLWLDVDPNGGTVGEPVIVGDLLIINDVKELWSGPPNGRIEVTGGATTAYDLATGAVRWSNHSARSHRLPVSSAAESNAALYAGPWKDSDGGQLALLSLENGQPLWNVPLPQVPGDTNVYAPSDVPPVVVGDTAYVVGSTQPTPSGSVQASLLSAVDLRTGDAEWMAQIDGGIVSEPIVSGGQIFVLTHEAGLYVLDDSPTPSATPVATPGTVVDLRTPVVCNAATSDSPMLGDLPATPTIPEVAPWKQPIPFSSIPSGVASNVDPATAQQLKAIFSEYRACSAVDPYHSVFGFFSTDFYVRLKTVQEYWGEPDQPWAVWMAASFVYLKLDTSTLQMLPDGRIGGLINGPTANVYVWFVQENGQWKIDEYNPIAPDPITPTTGTPVPSTNPEGTPLG